MTAEEVATTLRSGGPFIPRGGGTKATWGLPTEGTELDLRGLDRIVAVDAGDMVCVVEAGVRLVDLQARLAEDRLALMLDPADGSQATVGGVLATNACGPLRHRYGKPRDLVLGAQFVLTDGTIARSGGRVVKNVAGYDIARLLCGSLGTLAVLCEVALRLHPLPARRRTVVAQATNPSDAARAARALAEAPLRAEAVEVAWPERVVWATFAGEGVLPGVEAEAPALPPLCLESGALLGFGVPTTATAALLALADATRTVIRLRAGVGVGEARTLDDEAFAAGVRTLGGHVSPRRDTTVGYERDPVSLDLMRAVKARLDPDDRLSPGRLWPVG